MKTYIYKITSRKNDVNGNPRSLVTVYRIKRNRPILLGENVNIGYRSNTQAVCDIIFCAKWDCNYIHKNGWEETTPMRLLRNNKIRLFKV